MTYPTKVEADNIITFNCFKLQTPVAKQTPDLTGLGNQYLGSDSKLTDISKLFVSVKDKLEGLVQKHQHLGFRTDYVKRGIKTAECKLMHLVSLGL